MRWSHIPRWKFTDSCGRPGVPGALHLGCAHDAQMECHHATRRERAFSSPYKDRRSFAGQALRLPLWILIIDDL